MRATGRRRDRAGAARQTPLGVVGGLFVAAAAGEPMRPQVAVRAVAGRGLAGDRYARHAGHWSPDDECQVTVIAGEVLDEIAAAFGVSVHAGEHRRNVVTRGVDLGRLVGRTFRVGGALLAFDRPRPPCRYVASITEPGLTRALGARRGGIGARVLEGGEIRLGDEVAALARSS